MARKRISEFRAKTLLYQEFGGQYGGVQINDNHPLGSLSLASAAFDAEGRGQGEGERYVAKVDQGIKGRFKKGLVLLDQTAQQLSDVIQHLKDKGYSQFLVEEMTPHESSEEQYISIERTREGYLVYYSERGGVNIEENQSTIHKLIIPYDKPHPDPLLRGEGVNPLDKKFLQTVLQTFDKYYFSFLEINPFILHNSDLILLDAAVEVDSTAEFFVKNAWIEEDFTDTGNKERTEEEVVVQQLAAKSQAAFSLEVLNPSGCIFMMLSGGGASIVLADEIHNQGYGKELANYGEYSGNPNAEETYIYAKNVLTLLLKSTASKKVLIIAGGIANFTDIRKTFIGVIRALDEMKGDLQKQKIKIYVRRGGPYQEEGLEQMKMFLEKNNLLGVVAGPEMILTEIVTAAIKNI